MLRAEKTDEVFGLIERTREMLKEQQEVTSE
jgi:hypothetical protein